MSTYPDQITLSLPPKWNKIVRDNAKKENKSLNAYIKEILINEIEAEKPYPKYKEGEPVIYQCGDRFELGIIRTVCGNDEYFVNYHTGDTAARTHARNLHKIENGYAFFIERIKV